MPAVEALVGGAMTLDRLQRTGDMVLRALDATLGIEGLPQSATGQTTLFTGINAAEALGRHVPALPGPRLGEIIAEHSVLAKVSAAGRRVTFANAYSAGYLERLERGAVRASATTLAVRAAGIDFRRLDDLRAGEAVTFDVCGDLFERRSGTAIEPVAPEEAGRRLGAIAGRHDLTLFESFVTDLAGHDRWGMNPSEALRRVDGLLGGLKETIRSEDGSLTLLVTSDHGNLEEDNHRRHTRNPVPLLAVGPAAGRFADLESIADVAGRIIEVLGVG